MTFASARPASVAAEPAVEAAPFLVLSTSLLTERMLLHTGFFDELQRSAPVRLWTASRTASHDSGGTRVTFETFPGIRPFREFPYAYWRRLNDFTWDAVQRNPSRVSIDRHTRRHAARFRLLKVLARGLAAARLAGPLEDRLERWMQAYPRSPEALDRLRRHRPSVMLTTGPFQYEQPAVVAAARAIGIPTVALIPSWDNISTKHRMVFKYDGYLVWSEWTRRELHDAYPHSRRVPVHVTGAAQFDVFFQDRFRQSREDFCRSQGLRADRPVIVHAIGSPNFIREHHAAVEMARAVVRGDLGDVQLIVRPHPIHDRAEFDPLFQSFGPRVVVQRAVDAAAPLPARSQDAVQIREWVNTFRHADVVVNLSSTVAIDAAICDRPVVNLDYDPDPAGKHQALVKDLNRVWTHFKPIAQSGALWMVSDTAEMLNAVRTYLDHPELHRDQRREVALLVCGYLDGRCGERMARALRDCADRRPVHVSGAAR